MHVYKLSFDVSIGSPRQARPDILSRGALCRIREELYQDKEPAGRLARFHKPLQTPEQRRSANVAAARAHFCALGWARAEVEAGDVDRQLDSIIARARAMQEHEKRLDNMAEHQRTHQPLPNSS